MAALCNEMTELKHVALTTPYQQHINILLMLGKISIYMGMVHYVLLTNSVQAHIQLEQVFNDQLAHLDSSYFVFLSGVLEWHIPLHSLHLTPSRRRKVQRHLDVLRGDMREEGLVLQLSLLQGEGCLEVLAVLGERDCSRTALEILMTE